MIRSTFAFIILVLLSSLPVAAEEVLSLQEAIAIALKDNNQIKAMNWNVKTKERERRIAVGSLLPKIVFEERFLRTNNPTYAFMSKLNQSNFEASDFALDQLNNPDQVDNFQTIVSIEQPIFVKKAYVSLGMAKEMERATVFEQQRLREEMVLNVFRSYVQVVTAKEYVKVTLAGLDDAKEHLRIAQLRYDSGLGLYSDVLRSEVAVIEAEKAVIEAQKMMNVSKRALGLLLGRDDPVDVAGYDSINLRKMDIQTYLDSAKERYDVKAMEAKYNTAVSAVKLAEADYYPVVGIGGSYQLDDPDQPFGSDGESWSVMAFLRINVFDGFKRENERRKAQYEVSSAGEYLAALKKQVLFDVHSSYLTVEEMQKKYELAMTAVRSAEEGVRLVEKRYQNSLAPIVSLLDAQVSLDRARADEVAMHGEYLVSLMRLEYASGRALQALIPESGNYRFNTQIELVSRNR